MNEFNKLRWATIGSAVLKLINQKIFFLAGFLSFSYHYDWTKKVIEYKINLDNFLFNLIAIRYTIWKILMKFQSM